VPTKTIAGDLPAPMLAKNDGTIPVGDGWSYEPKWDGFRTIVAADSDKSARLVSRDGRPLGRYFPELVELVEASSGRAFVVDAEIVRADGFR
jgi:ATP-dependent DNA ligase